jgi:hypothetical protein
MSTAPSMQSKQASKQPHPTPASKAGHARKAVKCTGLQDTHTTWTTQAVKYPGCGRKVNIWFQSTTHIRFRTQPCYKFFATVRHTPASYHNMTLLSAYTHQAYTRQAAARRTALQSWSFYPTRQCTRAHTFEVVGTPSAPTPHCKQHNISGTESYALSTAVLSRLHINHHTTAKQQRRNSIVLTILVQMRLQQPPTQLQSVLLAQQKYQPACEQ